MRHLPKFSDDYGFGSEEFTDAAILSADLEEMVEAMGDDWSLEGEDELDLTLPNLH